MKKILILGKLPPPYLGPAIATQIILNSGLKDRFKLIHLDTRLNRTVSTIGKWTPLKPIKNFASYLKMLFLTVRWRPDLVLVPISQSTRGFLKDSVFILIAKMFGRRVILHLRGSNLKNWLDSTFWLGRKYVEWGIRRAHGAIVLGNNLRYLFKNYFSEDRIFVVPNGGDFNYSPNEKKQKEIVNLLYLSNLQPTKGIRDVVQAIGFLNQKSFTISTQVVGAWRDKSTREFCLNLVAENNLPVKFFSPKTGNEKKRFFEESDIFIFPPRAPEGHPWVIVEAMAAGLPIISTDQGAITESVIDGVNGFIVEPRNPEQIADRINYLLEHPDIRKKMGEESRRLYLDNFTEKQMVERLIDVFNHVISV